MFKRGNGNGNINLKKMKISKFTREILIELKRLLIVFTALFLS